MDPPTAPAYSKTTPTDISGQFLAGDEIVYSCNGDLSPDEPTTITCVDNDLAMAAWVASQVPPLAAALKLFNFDLAF